MHKLMLRNAKTDHSLKMVKILYVFLVYGRIIETVIVNNACNETNIIDEIKICFLNMAIHAA